MGFLDKLKGLLRGGASPRAPADPYGLRFYFKCNKCGDVVRIRVDRRNDLNREAGPGTFLLRKEVMDNKCFQLMGVVIWLDSSYNVVTADVSGGELISEEEYHAAKTGESTEA